VGADAARGVEPLPLGSGGSRLRGWIREGLYIPDSRVGWIPWARRAVRRLLAQASGPTVVYSTSVPYSAHLAAWSALPPGTPWVAEFRDPWSDAHPFLRPRTAWRRAIDDRLHQMIVRRADRVVVTTEATAERLAKKTGLLPERIVVARNGYEPTPMGPFGASPSSCDVLYAGSVAVGEDVRPVLEGLVEARRRTHSRITLHVLGPNEPWTSVARDVDGLSSTVEDALDGSDSGRGGDENRTESALRLRGTTDPGAARRGMAWVDANLLLNWHPAYEAIVPGKAYEYLGAGRPILAGVRPGTELAGLLRAYGDVEFVGGDDRIDWARAFAELAGRHTVGSGAAEDRRKGVAGASGTHDDGTDTGRPDRGDPGHDRSRPFGPSELTRRVQAQRVAEMLDSLVGRA